MRILIGIAALVFSGWLQAAESFLNESERAMLTPHPSVAGILRHVAPGVELGSYDKLLFGGVTMYFSEDSKYKDVDAAEVTAISDAMKAAMVQAATAELHVAEAPGPTTALINVAITDINLQKKKRGLLGFTPVGLVVTAAQDAAGMRMLLKDAKIEGELVDSLTGKIIAIFRVEDVPSKKGEKQKSWNDVSAVFEVLLEQGIIAARDE